MSLLAIMLAQPLILVLQIVGSPANPLSRLAAWGIHQTRQLLPVNGTRWIPTALWPVIHAEVLKQCDDLDGVSVTEER
jgi:feruloyl esterase